MATNHTSGVFNGLGTINLPVEEAGNHTIHGNINLPTISQGNTANSQVVVTIAINGGGTLYTGAAGAEGFDFTHSMSAGDVFNVTLTSSAAVDQGLNKIKTTTIMTVL